MTELEKMKADLKIHDFEMQLFRERSIELEFDRQQTFQTYCSTMWKMIPPVLPNWMKTANQNTNV
jgi:hypothetical protein